MKQKQSINERLSGNMAYLDNQIEKGYNSFISNYKKLFSQALPFDDNGVITNEMILGQFTMNCSKEELYSMTTDAKNDITYVNQCVDELDVIINDMPLIADYTPEQISSFVERVSEMNSQIYRGSLGHLRGLSIKSTRSKNADLPVRIVEEARKLIGTPYVWGGADPSTDGGVDCSGLVCYSANKAGYLMNRETTKTLINMGEEVAKKDLQIGDLIFPSSGHVGFYSGNGKFLHSPKPGDHVKEVDIYGFWRGRRIFPGVGGDSTSTPSGGGSNNSGSGDYYGPTGTVQWIERAPDPEVTKIIVPQGANNWATIASYLKVSESTLKSLNPGVKTLYAGTTLYIPTTAVTQARELAIKSKNQSAKYSKQLDGVAGMYSDSILMASSFEGEDTTSSQLRTSNNEDTPFQSFLNNEDYIKTHDLKPHDHKTKARIEIHTDGKIRTIQTLISPIGYSESYSNSINLNKTNGGWFISRHGEAPPTLNINGYLLDTKYAPEKHAFMNEFKNYMTDKVNKSTGDYENSAIIKIRMEGVEYQGYVTSITFNKDANRPTLYTFNMSFTCIYYKNVRDVKGAVDKLKPEKANSTGKSVYLAEGIASIIT